MFSTENLVEVIFANAIKVAILSTCVFRLATHLEMTFTYTLC
jgi:hypothetical protein